MPANTIAHPARTVSDHRDDSGRWCRWSHVAVTSGYDDDRCPAGCAASRIEAAPSHDDHQDQPMYRTGPHTTVRADELRVGMLVHFHNGPADFDRAELAGSDIELWEVMNERGTPVPGYWPGTVDLMRVETATSQSPADLGWIYHCYQPPDQLFWKARDGYRAGEQVSA